MNGAKDISQQVWESRNYRITSYVLSMPRSSWPLRFNLKRHQSSSFNSRFWVCYEVKQSSN